MSGRALVNRGFGAAGAPYAMNAILPRTAAVLANGLIPNRRSPFAMELEMKDEAAHTPRYERGLA